MMGQRHGLTVAATQGTWRGLPWLGLLGIPASIASLMTMTIAGGPALVDAPPTGVVIQASAEAAPAGIDRFSTDGACDTSAGRLLYVGLNTWIPAEPRLAACPEIAR
jgi:hypothetical protein